MAAKPPRFRNAGQSPRQSAAAAPAPAPEQLNGHPAKVEQILSTEVTAGQKPQLPVFNFRDENYNPWSFYLDIEFMLRHDAITTPLNNVMSPVALMQITAEASSTPVLKFMMSEWDKFKQRWLRRVQENSYQYGWMGAECVYDLESGKLVQSNFRDFHPRDVLPLVKDFRLCGVQVRNVPGQSECNLPNSGRGIPAKGFWYAHRARNGQRFGMSQIMAAWKPWRSLAGRDGLEEIEAIAAYRYGTGTVVVGYPMGDSKATNKAPLFGQAGTSGRASHQQRAQELGENVKSGGAIAIPTTAYPNGQPMWTYTVESAQANIAELLQFDDSLYGKCAKAIGWAPELSEASEVGSGYSGRMIPLQAFLMQQDHIAQALFWAWFEQIGRPLVWWNFGPHAWVRPKVIPLLKTFQQSGTMQQQQQPPQPGAQPQQGQQPAQGQPDGGGQPAPGGKSPYTGPRGGKGWVDPQGRIHYGRFLSTCADDFITFLSTGTEAFQRAAFAIDDDDQDTLARLLPDLSPEELEAIEAELTREEPAPKTPRQIVLPARPSLSAGDVRQIVESVVGDRMQLLSTMALEREPQLPSVVNVTTPDVHVAPANIQITTQLPDSVAHKLDEMQSKQDEMQQQFSTLPGYVNDKVLSLQTKHESELEDMNTEAAAAIEKLCQKQEATVEAIDKLCEKIENMPPPVVNVPETVVNVAPPVVHVVVPSAAGKIVPHYKSDGKTVDYLEKIPSGDSEPTVEVTPGDVKIDKC